MEIDNKPSRSARSQNRHDTNGKNPRSEMGMLFPRSSGEANLEGGVNFGRLLGTIKRRLAPVILITLAVSTATFYWSKSRPASYQGKFGMLIEPVTAESEVVSAVSGRGGASVESQDLGNTQATQPVLDYATQIEILRSPQLLNPVVRNLQSQYSDLTVENLGGGLTIERLAATKGKAETKILEVSYQESSPDKVQQILDTVSKAYIQYSFSERKTNLRRAIQFVDNQLPKVEAQVNRLEQELQAFRERYRLLDPASLGGQISAQAGEIQKQTLDNQVELLQTRQLYESLGNQLQLQPKSAEAASVLSEAPEFQKLLAQYQEVSTQLATTELGDEHPQVIALKEKQAQLKGLVEQSGQNALGNQLAGEFQDLQSTPYQNSLRQGLSKQFIDTSIQLNVLEARRRGIINAQQTLATQLRQMPAITRQYENLQRRLQIGTSTLQKFREQRESLSVNAAREEVPWELVAPPSVSRVAGSDTTRDVMIGTLLGLLMGVGVALLLEKANDILYSIPELKQEVDLPILGSVPIHKALSKAQRTRWVNLVEPNSPQSAKVNPMAEDRMGHYTFSAFLESFRSLHAQVRLLNPDVPVRSIVVSSCLPGEGKSTVAIHLAQAAAAMGRKVLLIDADLRSPSLSLALDLPSHPGLSNVIAADSEYQTALKKLDLEPNLHILTAGSPPTDPNRFIASQKMQHLMEIFHDAFDFVIYDAPPLGLADATMLAVQTDGLLLVSRLGVTRKAYLKESMRILRLSNVSVLGMVVNGVKEAGTLYPADKRIAFYGKV
jgi:capsular exopolysaccharide synthesis family protein